MEKAIDITYEQVCEITGQGQKAVDELLTYVLRKTAGPTLTLHPEDAFRIVLGDVLLALGVTQLAVVSLLEWLMPDIEKDICSLRMAAAQVENGKRVVIPWFILQIVEGRWVLYPGRSKMFDLEVRIEEDGRVGTPSLSTALNVTVLWLRTLAKTLGLDSVAARVVAGGLTLESGPGRIV